MNLLKWLFSSKKASPSFFIQRGNELLYSGNEQYKEAIAEFSKAIELDAQCTEAYINRGMGYYFCGEFELAGKDFHKSYEIKAREII